jgi:hypothetical protein
MAILVMGRFFPINFLQTISWRYSFFVNFYSLSHQTCTMSELIHKFWALTIIY